MKFRYARHTNNLKSISEFYRKVIGLEKLGGFENHSNYSGVFFGVPNLDWHLEFTESDIKTNRISDEDDLLVFYVNSDEELQAIVRDAMKLGIKSVKSRNPYWQINGIEFKDPDDFGIIIRVKQEELKSDDSTTQLIKKEGINTWEQFLNYVRKIPYGRNSHRTKFELVILENKGTCSTKHALIKQIADLNQVKEVKLIIGIYKMNQTNTKGIGNILSESELEYIPEAHCYIKMNGKRIDFTNLKSDFLKIENDVLEEREIEPYQVGKFKVEFHKKYIKRWKDQLDLNMTVGEIWAIREKCIYELQKETYTQH